MGQAPVTRTLRTVNAMLFCKMPLKVGNICTRPPRSMNSLPRGYFCWLAGFLLCGWHHGLFNESPDVDIWLGPKLFYYHKQL